MSIKAQCDEHGCSELLCGCHVSVLETSSDFHEILRAKDKWIRELLDRVDELEKSTEKQIMLQNAISAAIGSINELGTNRAKFILNQALREMEN